jgi:deazaflavin-dependent oxidoreductase (nitroreductase family)
MRGWIKAFMAAHTSLLRYSRGLIGNQGGGHSFLLLHNIGRNSGTAYTTPLSYFRDDHNYILVGSNWGRSKNPDWYFNLLERPITTIELDGKELQVEANLAGGEEYARLWRLVTSKHAIYRRYQNSLERRIPIVILKPIQHPS